MNNSNDKDELRFNKLYELLGDEINKIYDTKENENIFTDNNQNNNISNEVMNENNPIQEDITKEIYIEPTKVKINELEKKKNDSFNYLVNPFDNKRGKFDNIS